MENSPYVIFKEWLFDKKKDPLHENIIDAIVPIFIISMFGKHSDMTIFLNEYLNNETLMKLDKTELCNFIKELCSNKKKVTKFNLTYFPRDKKDKTNEKICKKLPFLKDYEIDIAIKTLKESNHEQLLEYLLDEPITKRGKKVNAGRKNKR